MSESAQPSGPWPGERGKARPPRSRVAYGIWILVVIALGLLSRRYPEFTPAMLGKSPGDALWALMVFLGVGFLFKSVSTGRAATGALIISFAVEFSQLYHAPWIDAVRQTLPGRLILGSGFLWADLIAYTVGAATGALAEVGVGKLRYRWHLGQ